MPSPSGDSSPPAPGDGARNIEMHMQAADKSVVTIDRGDSFELTKRQTAILRLLVEPTFALKKSDGWVTTGELLDMLTVRFSKPADSDQLNALIYTLRNRLDQGGVSRALVIRVRGTGTRFHLDERASVVIVPFEGPA